MSRGWTDVPKIEISQIRTKKIFKTRMFSQWRTKRPLYRFWFDFIETLNLRISGPFPVFLWDSVTITVKVQISTDGFNYQTESAKYAWQFNHTTFDSLRKICSVFFVLTSVNKTPIVSAVAFLEDFIKFWYLSRYLKKEGL